MMKPQLENQNNYSVHGYDSFDHESYPIASGLSLESAKSLADSKGGTMNIVYVHDADDNVVYQAGKY